MCHLTRDCDVSSHISGARGPKSVVLLSYQKSLNDDRVCGMNSYGPVIA